jgi:hypothetical protein
MSGMTNREIGDLIDAIKGRCATPNRFVRVENYFLCERPFTLHYTGGSIEVLSGHHVSFFEDAIVIKATKKHDVDTSKPLKESFLAALGAGLADVGATEHRIRWQSVSGISKLGW